MAMTTDDLRQHADNLRDTLHRKITELWDCNDPERRASLLTQTKELRHRIDELDQLTSETRRRN